MATTEGTSVKKRRTPRKVDNMDDALVNSMNKDVITAISLAKQGKRGSVCSGIEDDANPLSFRNKYLVAKYASTYGTSAALKCSSFLSFKLRSCLVEEWRNAFNINSMALGRLPRDAIESGLTKLNKINKIPILGDKNTKKICNYLRALSKSGCTIHKYTTAIAIKSYLLATKQHEMLKEFGGCIDPCEISLIKQLWNILGLVKPKNSKNKTKKNKNKSTKHPLPIVPETIKGEILCLGVALIHGYFDRKNVFLV